LCALYSFYFLSSRCKRISELAEGFTKYTTTTKIVSQGNGLGTFDSNAHKNDSGMDGESRQSTEAAITLAKDSADILLTPEGNLVQNLIVEESATALSAQVKDTLRELLVSNPERIRSSLALGLGNFLPKGPVEQLEPFLIWDGQKNCAENEGIRLMSRLKLIK
jgi:hypothetical protein